MRRATVTEAKNGLSALLVRVKAGETILITDRGVPVARLEPVSPVHGDAKLARLEREGLVRRGTERIPRWIIDEPPPRVPDGVSVVDYLLEERRSGR